MGDETNAKRFQRDAGKGLWRNARKEHGCDRFFQRTCRGDGLIRKGDAYFDTEELREWTKGPIFYRVCSTCALHVEGATDLPASKFTTAYADSFAS
jgi:hypothetical protein